MGSLDAVGSLEEKKAQAEYNNNRAQEALPGVKAQNHFLDDLVGYCRRRWDNTAQS